MAEGPAEGLVILDTLAVEPRLTRWPPLHIARAELLNRAGRADEAVGAYRQALELKPSPAEHRFIRRGISELSR